MSDQDNIDLYDETSIGGMIRRLNRECVDALDNGDEENSKRYASMSAQLNAIRLQMVIDGMLPKPDWLKIATETNAGYAGSSSEMDKGFYYCPNPYQGSIK